jgi:hypothetical protein
VKASLRIYDVPVPFIKIEGSTAPRYEVYTIPKTIDTSSRPETIDVLSLSGQTRLSRKMSFNLH